MSDGIHEAEGRARWEGSPKRTAPKGYHVEALLEISRLVDECSGRTGHELSLAIAKVEGACRILRKLVESECVGKELM